MPGHEVVGLIDEVGPGASEWKKGQRVGVGWHGGHDGTCRACRRGDFRNCRSRKVPGISYDGGYQEYMVAPVEAVVRNAGELSATEAAPLLCAGATTFDALRNSGALPGDLVAVLGVGGLGHLGIQFASKFGYSVAAIGRGSEDASVARELGASVYIDSKATNAAAELQKLGGAQAILATAPSAKAMADLLAGLAPNGKLLVIGASTEPMSVSPFQLIPGSLSMKGCSRRRPGDGGHAALRRAERRAADDRNLSARESRRRLRAHAERPGAVPRRPDDVTTLLARRADAVSPRRGCSTPCSAPRWWRGGPGSGRRWCCYRR